LALAPVPHQVLMAMPQVFFFLCTLAIVSALEVEVWDLDEAIAQDDEVEKKEALQHPEEPRRFMDAVRDMRSRWRAHKQAQMQTLEPWKVKAFEEKKMRHRAERAQVERRGREEAAGSGSGAAETQSKEDDAEADEQQKKSAEAKKIEKFGPQYVFVLREMTGDESLVKFRAKTHMRVLMQSIFQRMLLSPEQAGQMKFMFGKHEITSYDTPEQLGMKDHDVIMLQGQLMEKKLAQKQEATKRTRAISQLAAKADWNKNRQRILDARQRIAKENHQKAVEAQEVLAAHFRENHMIHLNFTDGHGKSVRLGFQRDKSLAPLFDIACKRLGFLPEATHFKTSRNGTMEIIHPTDTVRELGLKEDSVVTVKFNKRFSTAAPMEGPVV